MAYLSHEHLHLPPAAVDAFHHSIWETNKALTFYDGAVDEILVDRRLSLGSARFLERLWRAPRNGDPLTMARRDVREVFTQSTVLTLLDAAQSDFDLFRGENRLRMLTTCPSNGYSAYEAPILKLQRVREHFKRAMARRRFEGFGVLDFALLVGNCGYAPKELGIHVHAACRPYQSGSRGVHQGSSRRRNCHGLAVVDVALCDRPLGWSDVAGLGYYCTKLSCGLKHESGRGISTSQLGWESGHVLRALELMSFLSPERAFVAVGPIGERLASRCLQDFKVQHETASAQGAVDVEKTALSWSRVYSDLDMRGRELIRWH
jgi:hypothetical protein